MNENISVIIHYYLCILGEVWRKYNCMKREAEKNKENIPAAGKACKIII